MSLLNSVLGNFIEKKYYTIKHLWVIIKQIWNYFSHLDGSLQSGTSKRVIGEENNDSHWGSAVEGIDHSNSISNIDFYSGAISKTWRITNY